LIRLMIGYFIILGVYLSLLNSSFCGSVFVRTISIGHIQFLEGYW
jgi:uncharacterized membrane protein